MDVEESKLREAEQFCINTLTKGGRNTNVRHPVLLVGHIKIIALHTPRVDRYALLLGMTFNHGFFLRKVRVLPDPFIGADECLGDIVGCHTYHHKFVFKRSTQQLVEHVIATVKAAKNGDSYFLGTHKGV